MRDNWTVALAYDEEGDGPWLVDLSHKTRWDLQDGAIDGSPSVIRPYRKRRAGALLPDNLLINRMNGTQASIYHLGSKHRSCPIFRVTPMSPNQPCFLSLFGPNAFYVAEKLTNLDFMDPAKDTPFLLQGPFCHVPCQIVTLEKIPDGSGGFLADLQPGLR